MRALLRGLLLAGLLVARQAWACDCPQLPPDQVARGATLFFAGETRIPREVVPEGGASFQHSLIWKGPSLSVPIVAGNSPDGDKNCAFTFYLSQTYSVLAYGSYDTGYYTDKCAMSRVNDDTPERQKILSYLSILYVRLQSFIQDNGTPNMQDIVALRRMAKFYLDSYSPEQAQLYYHHASIVSHDSIVDMQGEGEAFLQLGQARSALTRFDDVLEKDNTQQTAWSGRYKALALMGRWSELPKDGADLTDFIWKQATLKVDLLNPKLVHAWWMQVDASGRKLTGADFSHAELSAVSLRGSDLSGANFSDARLFNVDLSGATLNNVKFDRVNYEQVKWPEGFTPPASTPLPLVGQQNTTGR